VSLAGLVLVDLLGLLLLLWVLNLVRVGRLYVGYGVLLAMVLVAGTVTLSTPPLARRASQALAAFFPSPWAGVAVLGLAFLLAMLVYVLTQVTVLANRLATLVQALAIERARRTPGAEAPKAERVLPPYEDEPRRSERP
jgi:hypothetical protein